MRLLTAQKRCGWAKLRECGEVCMYVCQEISSKAETGSS